MGELGKRAVVSDQFPGFGQLWSDFNSIGSKFTILGPDWTCPEQDAAETGRTPHALAATPQGNALRGSGGGDDTRRQWHEDDGNDDRGRMASTCDV